MKRTPLKRRTPLRSTSARAAAPVRDRPSYKFFNPNPVETRVVGAAARADPKEETLRLPKYRAWLANQPCANCSASPPNQCSHHGVHGVALKPDDRCCIPLCFQCHMHGWHRTGELDGRTQTREERREWLRKTAAEHYARFLAEQQEMNPP